MVSTRGPKSKFFEGEKVLCYEPDLTKAKVLYDSKVLGTYETKDKRGRKLVQYKIHFQGWSSSWDRKVNANFVLKDTEENRQLQKDLADKAQLQLGSYLYRKERKKRSRKSNEEGGENSAGGTGESSPKIRNRGSSEDNFSSGSTFEKNEGHFLMRDECETESCCSSVESFHDDDRVLLKVSERLKQYLEFDYEMTVKHDKQHILPARIPVVAILENFVKQSAVKLVFSSTQAESSRRRNTNMRSDKRERDYDKLLNTVSLLKEVADGLRIYFDFTIADNLLYKEERDHAMSLLSEESLKNFSYVASPGLSPDFLLPKIDTEQSTAAAAVNSAGNMDNTISSTSSVTVQTTASIIVQAVAASSVASHTSSGTSCSSSTATGPVIFEAAFQAQPNEEPNKRKLRSHRSDDCDVMLENCLSSIASTSSGGSTPLQSNATPSSLNYIKYLQPMALTIPTQTKEFLQKVLSWQILPSNAAPTPSMIFGAPHLARLIVRLPDFLNASSIADDKLKLLLQHLDAFVNYLESRKEWFGEENYFKSTKSPNCSDHLEEKQTQPPEAVVTTKRQ